MSDENVPPRIIKPPNALKHKVGNGGINDKAAAMAERRLDNSAEIFPTIAANEMKIIEEALASIEKGDTSEDVMMRVYAACIELKSHSAQFKFPLVTAMADGLCNFLDAIGTINPIATATAVISLYLKTLKIAIAQGPRAVEERDRVELLSGLERACQKALAESKS
jgi:hypothetical protein